MISQNGIGFGCEYFNKSKPKFEAALEHELGDQVRSFYGKT
jgi:hypothetical protein